MESSQNTNFAVRCTEVVRNRTSRRGGWDIWHLIIITSGGIPNWQHGGGNLPSGCSPGAQLRQAGLHLLPTLRVHMVIAVSQQHAAPVSEIVEVFPVIARTPTSDTHRHKAETYAYVQQHPPSILPCFARYCTGSNVGRISKYYANCVVDLFDPLTVLHLANCQAYVQ